MSSTNKGSDYIHYNDLSFRVCYGLKDGKMDFEHPLYETHKACQCETCKRQWDWRGITPNMLTVTTDAPSKFQEVKSIVDNWTCNGKAKSYHEKRTYLRV